MYVNTERRSLICHRDLAGLAWKIWWYKILAFHWSIARALSKTENPRVKSYSQVFNKGFGCCVS